MAISVDERARPPRSAEVPSGLDAATFLLAAAGTVLCLIRADDADSLVGGALPCCKAGKAGHVQRDLLEGTGEFIEQEGLEPTLGFSF